MAPIGAAVNNPARRERENGLCRGFFFEKAVFPFSRGKNRTSQGVENRGSLISAPLALRVIREMAWGGDNPVFCGIFVEGLEAFPFPLLSG